jgi:hypothetical protein
LTRLSGYSRPGFPTSVHLRTAAYRYRRQHWVEIDGLREVHLFAEVSAVIRRSRGGRALTVTTDGVTALSLHLEEAPERWQDGDLTVEIDGATVCAEGCWGGLHFALSSSGSWTAVDHPPDRAGLKRPGLEGPAQDALYEGVTLVYGTQDPELEPFLRHLAYSEQGFRDRADVEFPVMADVEVTADLMERRHLVLYGTPDSNAVLGEMRGLLPIEVRGGSMTVGSEPMRGDDLSAVFIFPNPLAPDRYVIVKTGTSMLGLDGVRFAPRYLPDFAVFGPQMRTALDWRTFRDRPVLAGGFFEDDWSLPADRAWLLHRAE